MRKYILHIILNSAFLILNAFCFSQNAKIDSLKKVLLTAKEDTNKVKVLIGLALEFSNSDLDTAAILSMQSLAIAEKIKFEIGIGKANHNLGWFNIIKGDFAKALEYEFKALALWKKLFPPEGGKMGATTLGNIGLVYSKQADYPKAIHYFLRAMKVDEELGNKNGMAQHLGNIGLVYYFQANYRLALDYYFRALKMAEELGNKNNLAAILGNIGIVYKDQADYSKALDYYLKAKNILEELGDKNKISVILANIGIVYMFQADFPKAFDYYFKALKIDEELGNKNDIAINLGNIGSLYIITGKFKDAEKYLKHSLALSDTIGDLEGMKGMNKELSRLYDTTGRYELALDHYKKYISIRDTIANDENTKKQTQTEMQYEFDKKETQTKAEQDKKDAVTKIIIYSISGGLFLVLVLAGFIFRSFRQKQKANIIISQQKEEVEKQKQLVEEKQKDILDSIHYAKRIQQSLMPTGKYIEKNLKKLIKN